MSHSVDIRGHRSVLDGAFVLVLTSNSHEKDAVNRHLSSKIDAHINQAYGSAKLGIIGARFVLHLSGESGVSKPRSIGRIATAFLGDLTQPKPTMILLAGFCWGNPARTKPGDVVVCSELFSMNVAHALEGASVPQLSICSSTLSFDEAVIAEMAERSQVTIDEIHVGPLASLETLFKSDAVRDQLLAKHPQLLGGEMEGFAFLQSGMPWLVIKTVSDFGGDAFDRESQNSAADRAARLVWAMMTTSSVSSAIPAARNDPHSDRLRDLVSGNRVVVLASALRADAFTTQINDEVGPIVEYKLRRYVFSGGLPEDSAYRVMVCLLEIAQNALTHGHASEVSIVFDPTRVVIEDDGGLFDLEALERSLGRGGSRSIRRLRSDIDSGLLEVSSGQPRGRVGNVYTFRITGASARLTEVKAKCSVVIPRTALRPQLGGPARLSFNPACEVLYLDATEVRMTSLGLDVASVIFPLLQSGKHVMIGCANEDQVDMFKECLVDAPPGSFSVFVDLKAPGLKIDHHKVP